ncbi:MAG: universal stress protein [Herbiconiux sp.]|uniref:universal stress protein n=1 Tax=Herbiconiux sp. TaxID=1871186 RepID=UPI0012048EA2|nr:universal stress protein [Herbiconiux sp.]TAJ47604.1 MAG: universal stress protein [Herbiconiux sp.]
MRYIVGYTDTPAGHDALALAVRLARTNGAQLDLVLVLASEQRPTIVPADPGYEKYLLDTAEGWLADARARVPADVATQPHVVYAESLTDGLNQAADDLGAELIVIGAARGGILGRFAIGSAANALLHSASVPVALAPDGCRALEGSPALSRITCAVGTRAGADELLTAGIRAARSGGIPLRLISLVALDLPPDERLAQALRRAETHARAVLEQAVAHLPDDLTVTTEVVIGDVIEHAVATVDWDPAEIVLIGSSRLAQPKHLFLGSTAAKMLRELPVPLVVVPRDSGPTIGDL